MIHLLFSANRWEAAAAIQDAIAYGTTVVIDRYYYSGLVYSAAKNNPTLSLQWAKQPEIGLPRPDLCLFLDITPAKAAERGGFGGERYEKQEMQTRVRNLFHELFQYDTEKGDIRVIDAGRSIPEVEADIWRHVSQLITSDSLRGPLRIIGGA